MPLSADIISTGARTPLGQSSAAAAAALRAGISATVERPFLSDRPWTPKQAALDSELDDCLVGADRLLALLRSALVEACAPFKGMSTIRSRLPVFLALPEFRPGFSAQDTEVLRRDLTKVHEFPVEISEVYPCAGGHAAGLWAFAAALEGICRGTFEICLVAGVDSYFHVDTLHWLDEARQLAGGDARSAFVPGEGAGVCLLASPSLREQLGILPSMRLVAVAIGEESKRVKTAEVCLGHGLTSTVQDALHNLPPGEKISTVICDINGERYRSEEWAFVCLRLSQYFDDITDYLSPADCWGDMGAASTPLFAMLVGQAAVRGYAKGSRSMLWASSEGGLRGAAVVETIHEA